MTHRKPHEQDAWRVTIPGHKVGGSGRKSYVIPNRTVIRFELTREAALQAAANVVHIEASVPPWRSMVAETVQLSSAAAFRWIPGTDVELTNFAA